MPVVNVKGVANPMQFPDEMPINDIRNFLRNKFSQRAISGQSDILAPKANIAAPTQPTLSERAGQGVSDFLFDKGIIQDRHGAQQVGSNLAALGEFIPGIGDAAAGDEFGRAVAQGDGVGMGLGLLGAIPIAGDALRGGVTKAKKLVDDLDFKYKTDLLPLQNEWRAGVTAERKSELLKEKRILSQPLDAAKRELSLLERELAPKPVKVDKKPEQPEQPNKTFKGKVFHQTDESFNDFDFNKTADGTVWFTGDKKNFSDPSSSASAASGKGRVLERDVELKKVAGFKELDQFSVGELRQQGFDGAVLDGDVQVFDPKAIKG